MHLVRQENAIGSMGRFFELDGQIPIARRHRVGRFGGTAQEQKERLGARLKQSIEKRVGNHGVSGIEHYACGNLHDRRRRAKRTCVRTGRVGDGRAATERDGAESEGIYRSLLGAADSKANGR